jgi:tripartite ATP-independent transporter DctP family solute receptor
MNMKSTRIFAILLATTLFAACAAPAAPPATAPVTPAAPTTPADPGAPADAADGDFSHLSFGRRVAAETDRGTSIPLTSTSTFNLRLAHAHTLDNPYHVASEYLAQLIYNRTGGNVNITVYGAATLGNATETIEAVMMNTIDFTVVGVGPLINFNPYFGLFDLPFLFESFEHAYAVLDGPMGEWVLGGLEAAGVIGLGYWEGFMMTVHANTPIPDVPSLEGRLMRTMESPLHMGFMTEIGAVPLPMPFGEVFTALDTGTIDGLGTNMPSYITSRFYLPAPYTLMTKHFYSCTPILASAPTWNRLPEDYQAIIREAVAESVSWQRWYNQFMINRDMTRLEEEQGLVWVWPSDSDLDLLRAAGERVTATMVPSVYSYEMIEEIRNTPWESAGYWLPKLILGDYEPVWENWD